MDTPAAAHRLSVGVTATEEHKSQDGAEITQWVAETTQVSPLPFFSFLCFTPTSLYN